MKSKLLFKKCIHDEDQYAVCALSDCNTSIVVIDHCHWDPQASCFLGVDIDDGQLQKANENITFAELGNRIHLLRASSMGRKPVITAVIYMMP